MSCIDSLYYAEGPYDNLPHSHKTYQVLFSVRGILMFHIDSVRYMIDKPSIVFINHRETHTFSHVNKNYCRYVMNILPEQARTQISDSDRLLSPFTNRPANFSHVLPVEPISDRLKILLDMLNQERKADDFPPGEATILQMFLQCLYRFEPVAFPFNKPTFASTVQQIKQRLEQNPAQEITLTDLAEEYHVSVSYLAHSFKEITGYSVGRFHLLCRLAAAKNLLNTTDDSVTDIGVACGFSDMSNFSRYFRREIGCTPSEFRKNKPVN